MVVLRDEKALPRRTALMDGVGGEGKETATGPSVSPGGPAASGPTTDAGEPKAKVMPSELASPTKSTSSSGSKSSPAKSVSFQIEENDGERVMSSVESESGVSSQAQRRASLDGKVQ
ncbi:hypothetical protein BDV93DRAFT_79045 [Ceratobasidium sp. AG-I]|nr:hypothetical protein BDV93DRAFT_79045 [Ceratobasidium sp. AG-I]